MAQDAVELFNLDRVLLVPCCAPPHKDPRPLAPAADRLAMLHAAVAGIPCLAISTIEIDRGGRSYTVDTIRDLQLQFPADDFFFIIGDDSLADLPNWRRIGDLLLHCEFLTLARPGISLPEDVPAFAPAIRQRLLQQRRTGHCLNISSTEIRQRVAEQLPIRYLVPETVADYIAQNGLYRDKTPPTSITKAVRKPAATDPGKTRIRKR